MYFKKIFFFIACLSANFSTLSISDELAPNVTIPDANQSLVMNVTNIIKPHINYGEKINRNFTIIADRLNQLTIGSKIDTLKELINTIHHNIQESIMNLITQMLILSLKSLSHLLEEIAPDTFEQYQYYSLNCSLSDRDQALSITDQNNQTKDTDQL